MDWDRILSSAPLNKEAATVTSDGWESGLRNFDKDPYERDGPHKTRRIEPNPQMEILTDRKIGSFKVLGAVADIKANSRGVLWSVRCDCGTYTARRTKALLESNRADEDMIACSHCKRTREIKLGLGTVNIHTGKIDRR